MSRRMIAAGAALASFLPAGVANAETWSIVPSVSLTETYSDNVELLPDNLAIRGWITDLAPGIRIDLAAARAKGFLDFRLHDLSYAGESRLNNTQKTLSSRLTVEAVEKWLFFDARADVTQQNRSPFGSAVTPDQPSLSRNRVETSTLQVAPFFRGRLADAANYLVRYNAAESRTNEANLPDTRTGEFLAHFESAALSARFGWAVDGNGLSLRNDQVGTLRDSRIRASLIYTVTPSLKVSASDGYEKTDFAGPEEENSTPGLGLTWTPSERTQLAALAERRFFGTGHSLLFGYRTPLTAWRLASVKDAAVLPAGISSGNVGSIAGLMSFLLTSSISDPDARAEAARRRIEEYGFAENSLLSSSVVNFRPYVYRNSTASVALLRPTGALTLTYLDREDRYSPVGTGVDASLSDTRQRGYVANWARRMTPLTTLTIFGRALRTIGLAESAPDTRQTDYGITFSSRLGQKATASFGVRRASFSTTVPNADYRENSIFAFVTVRP